MPLTDAVVAAHKQIGTDPAFLGPVETLIQERIKVRAQKFVPEKQAAEDRRLYDEAAGRLTATLADKIAKLEHDRDREIAQVISQEQAERSGRINKRPDEFTADYEARMVRQDRINTLRGIRASLTSADVTLITMTDDQATIADVVDEAFESEDADAIRRVCRAAIPRMLALAKAGAKGNRTTRTDLISFANIEARYKAWRQTEAGQTGADRKRAITQTYSNRLFDVRTQFKRIEESFELAPWLREAAARAAQPVK